MQRKMLKFVVGFLCIFLVQAMPKSTKFNGAIFDTQCRDAETFAPGIFLAREQGLELKYQGIDQILDHDMDALLQAAGNVAFFQFDTQFFRAWSESGTEQSLGCKKYLKLLSTLATKPDCLIFLMLPPLGNNPAMRFEVLKPLLQMTGFGNVQSQGLQLEALKNFLATPLETRKIPYHTTLTPPMLQIKKSSAEAAPGLHSWFFPANWPKTCSLLDNFFPLAFKLELDGRSLGIAPAALLWLLSPTENFQLLPIEKGLLNYLPVLLSQFFREIYALCAQEPTPAALRPEEVPSFDRIFAALKFSATPQTEAPRVNFSKVSWMELADFCEFGATSAEIQAAKNKAQSKLIDRTLDAQLDWVWINLSPNTFLPEKSINASRATETIAGLKKFSEQLSNRAQERRLEMPKFLLGFELGNNIVSDNGPKNFAQDLFGNEFTDIPEPLDFDFWKDELLRPLKSFLDLWNKTEQARLLPVQGVVADIEFYNRKWTSSFLPTMGFAKSSRELFALQDASFKRAGKISQQEFLKNLSSKKKCGHYFKFLQKSSELLGEKIRTQVEKLLPNKPFSVYLPSLNFDWFHTGFFRGLSQKSPLHIFSFNAHFDATAGLLAQKGIRASHSAPFMLSKLTDHDGFTLAEDLYKKNRTTAAPTQAGGVWLNRFSRIANPFAPGEWFFLEQTTASNKTRDQFCRALQKLN